MTVQVHHVHFYRLLTRTRFPFRYGIASMEELPHLIVKVSVEVDGKLSVGMSSDGLAPKWFTKNPDTTFAEDDLPQMLRVIRNAADLAVDVGCCPSFFRWWKNVYDGQTTWAAHHDLPGLLTGFGVSLIERAVLDAVCRAHQLPLHAAAER